MQYFFRKFKTSLNIFNGVTFTVMLQLWKSFNAGVYTTFSIYRLDGLDRPLQNFVQGIGNSVHFWRRVHKAHLSKQFDANLSI